MKADIEYKEDGTLIIGNAGEISEDLFCYLLTEQFFGEETALAEVRHAAEEDGRDLAEDLALFLEQPRGVDH